MARERSKKARGKAKRRQFAKRDARLAELGFACYSDYIRSPLWVARRRRFYATRLRVCEVCGAIEGPIFIHHCSYYRLGEESDNDLVSLCERCHALAHTYRRTFGWPAVNRMRAAFEEYGDPLLGLIEPKTRRSKARVPEVRVIRVADLSEAERAKYAL